MPPADYKRKWIKLWIDECLTGTIREDLLPDERSVWYDFLLYAGRNRPPGCISANENTPIANKRLAAILNIEVNLLARSIKKFQQSGRIRVRPNGVIYITSWDKYQYTDYDRQKPYRQKQQDEQGADLDPILSSAIKCYEDNIGMATPHMLEEMKLLCGECPEGWLNDAIKEAANQNKRSMAYIKGILKRWQSQGRDDFPQPPKQEEPEHEMFTDENGFEYYIGAEGIRVY